MDDVLTAVWASREGIFERLTSAKGRRQLSAYQVTIDRLLVTDVSADAAYQTGYSTFYRMSRRPEDWRSAYFALLEQEKRNMGIQFPDALARLFELTGGRVEASFASKMVATIRQDAPVYDSVVIKNLGISKPSFTKHKSIRMSNAVSVYDKICAFYAFTHSSEVALDLVKEFGRRLPEFAHFTPIKKIDILLWQMRPPAF